MKTLEIVKLLGAASCCLVLAVSAAKADAISLSDNDLDRVTAGQLTPPPPLFPPPSGVFELGEGLLNPPSPPPQPDPPAATPPSLPDARALPGQFLGALLSIIRSGGLR
jgi:hypothetical protein